MENIDNTRKVGTVFEYFLRVVKNHDNYPKAKKALNQLLFKDRAFGHCSNIRESLKSITSCVDRDFREGKFFAMGEKTEYDYITVAVNFFLHHFLERRCGLQPMSLNMYGQEIFDLACFSLYGDSYLEVMDNLNEGAPRPQNEYEAMLLGEYMHRLQSGENVTWEQILSNHRGDNVEEILERIHNMPNHHNDEYDNDDEFVEDDRDLAW